MNPGGSAACVGFHEWSRIMEAEARSIAGAVRTNSGAIQSVISNGCLPPGDDAV
jgi:hypothetical protein